MKIETPPRPIFYLAFVLCSVVHFAHAIRDGIPSEALATLGVICLGLVVLMFPEHECLRCRVGIKQSGLCDDCKAPDDAQFQRAMASTSALTDAVLHAAAAQAAAYICGVRRADGAPCTLEREHIGKRHSYCGSEFEQPPTDRQPPS